MPTILVADDNSNIQKMVTLAMKDQGIDVVAVGNGEAAVRKLPELHPDLVLADIFMPVRTGYEVCEFVKHDARFAHIPVVLLVGAFDPLDEQEVKRVGADGVLKKPFVPPDPLITMVKTVLEKAASEHLVPVAVRVTEAKVSEAAAHAEAPAAEAAPAPAPEMTNEPAGEVPEEELSAPRPRFIFDESETPLAFEELLANLGATPEVQGEPATPAPEPTTPPETGLGEFKFWQPAAEETPSGAERPPWHELESMFRRKEEGAAPESLALEPTVAVEEAAKESSPPLVEPGPLPDLAPSAAEWVASGPAHPPISLPPETTEEWTTAPVEEATPPVAEGPLVMPPSRFEEAPAETISLAKVTPEVVSSVPVIERPPAEMPKEAPPAPSGPAEPAHSGTVISFSVPQPADPALVEAIAAKVMERMQPQIVEIVTREILKPVVEALVRRELERQ